MSTHNGYACRIIMIYDIVMYDHAMLISWILLIHIHVSSLITNLRSSDYEPGNVSSIAFCRGKVK